MGSSIYWGKPVLINGLPNIGQYREFVKKFNTKDWASGTLFDPITKKLIPRRIEMPGLVKMS